MYVSQHVGKIYLSVNLISPGMIKDNNSFILIIGIFLTFIITSILSISFLLSSILYRRSVHRGLDWQETAKTKKQDCHSAGKKSLKIRTCTRAISLTLKVQIKSQRVLKHFLNTWKEFLKEKIYLSFISCSKMQGLLKILRGNSGVCGFIYGRQEEGKERRSKLIDVVFLIDHCFQSAQTPFMLQSHCFVLTLLTIFVVCLMRRNPKLLSSNKHRLNIFWLSLTDTWQLIKSLLHVEHDFLWAKMGNERGTEGSQETEWMTLVPTGKDF